MSSVSFFVPGECVAKGRARAVIRSSKAGKNWIGHYTPKKTEMAESAVAAAARSYFPVPLMGPIELRAVFFFKLPESWSKKKKAVMAGTYKTSKPDLDNLQKLAKDSLNSIAWIDDAQVARVLCAKKYVGPDDQEGTAITITEL